MQAFLEEGQGDEVVMLEPAFDIYSPQVQMAGAASVFVTLHPPPHTDAAAGWSLDLEELEAAITLNTRILLLNTPHNPTGWVLDEQQAVGVAAILTRHPHVLCITDEVYEHLVYAPHKHVRLGSLPGMWDRVLTVSSAGKTFSVTGWKIGWVCRPTPAFIGKPTPTSPVYDPNLYCHDHCRDVHSSCAYLHLLDRSKP